LKDEDFVINDDMIQAEAYDRIEGLSLHYSGARYDDMTIYGLSLVIQY